MQLSLQKFSALRAPTLIWGLAAALAMTVAAQDGPIVARRGIPNFQQLTRNSGYIFTGTDLRIAG